MKPTNLLILLLAIVATAALTRFYYTSGASSASGASGASGASARAPAAAAKPAPAPAPRPAPQTEPPAPQIPDNSQAPQTPPAPDTTPRQHDPMAREALGFVGSDSDADALWEDAINNPKLSRNERKNLIEDLNEDGLSNPAHPQMSDLPLIIKRLQLIEQLRPDAMDTTNANAFDEAHKDLSKMYRKLTGTAWGQ